MATCVKQHKLHVGLANSATDALFTDARDNNVLITDGNHAAIQYDVTHDRAVKSWYSGHSQYITSPVYLQHKESSLVCIINKQRLANWQVSREEENIDSVVKKIKLKSEVYTLVSCGHGDSRCLYVLFGNGGICKLAECGSSDAIIKPNSDVALSKDTVVVCDTAASNDGTHVICVILQTGKKLRSSQESKCTVLVYSVSTEGSWRVFCHDITLSNGQQTVTVVSWCLGIIKGQTSLLALGRDSSLFSVPVTPSVLLHDSPDNQSLDLNEYELSARILPPQYSVSGQNTAAAAVEMKSLRQNTLVIAGVEKHVEKGRSQAVMLVYDVVYGVIIADVILNNPLESGQRVFVCGDAIYMADSTGGVMMYDCSELPSMSLASLMMMRGGQQQQHHGHRSQASLTWTSQSGNSEDVDVMETEESAAAPSTSHQEAFDHLISLVKSKNPSEVRVRNYWNRLSTDVSSSMSMCECDVLMRALLSNSNMLSKHKELAITILSHLHTSHRCYSECIDTLTERGHFDILQHLIFPDSDTSESGSPPHRQLDEHVLVNILKHLLGNDAELERSSDQSTWHHFIDKLLLLPFNEGVLIVEVRQQLSVHQVKMLFKHINDRLQEGNIHNTLFITEHGKQLCEWLTCLVDAHFLSLVMATDSYQTLLNLKDTVDLQVEYLGQLDAVDRIVRVVQCRARSRGHQAWGGNNRCYRDYRIEVAHFT